MTPAVQIEKADYKVREESLRIRLLALQKDLAASDRAILILMNGVEGSGKGETTRKLLEWLDARGVETNAFWTAQGEESEHPPLWRFWQKIPARGRVGIFFGSWYTQPIIDRAFKNISKEEFERQLGEIRNLEEMLIAEGVILIKFWMYLSLDAQKDIAKARKAKAATRWRISSLARKFARKRKRFQKVDLEVLSQTHTTITPWTIIDAASERSRELAAGETLVEKLRRDIGFASSQTAAIAACKQAQTQWKTLPRAGRKTEDALWAELRAVIDPVFDKAREQQQAQQSELEAQAAARQAVLDELAALSNADPEALRQADSAVAGYMQPAPIVQ